MLFVSDLLTHKSLGRINVVCVYYLVNECCGLERVISMLHYTTPQIGIYCYFFLWHDGTMTNMYARAHTHTHTHIYTFSLYTHIYIYMCVCVYKENVSKTMGSYESQQLRISEVV
jgi:hypothetical protein